MRNICLVVLAFFCLSLMTSARIQAQSPIPGTGTALLEECTLALEQDLIRVHQVTAGSMKVGVCMGYVQGVADAYADACPPEDVQAEQVIRVAVKYLNDHPEKLHLNRAALTKAALKQAFPCPK
jgi:hypothetical protein